MLTRTTSVKLFRKLKKNKNQRNTNFQSLIRSLTHVNMNNDWQSEESNKKKKFEKK